MYQKAMGFLKGMAAGTAVGIAMVTVGQKMMHDNRHLNHTVNKATRAVTHLVNEVGTVMKP